MHEGSNLNPHFPVEKDWNHSPSLGSIFFSSGSVKLMLIVIWPLFLQSEYIAEADERREYMSGFDGSAGKC